MTAGLAGLDRLLPPGLGPIVGHTTARSSRIWVRAGTETDDGDHPVSGRRTVGVIGVVTMNGEPFDPMKTFYFRLHREFDRSGSINLGVGTPDFGLLPNSEYEVKVGCLVLDDAGADDTEVMSDELLKLLPPSSAWQNDLAELDAEKSGAIIRTFPEYEDFGRMSFLLGSCRYPGLLWKARHSDRIFGAMVKLTDALWDCPRFVLMVGDQIYADLFNRAVPFGRADTYKEFRDRYLAAFSSPSIRRLMRKIPTYMILDDHEIEDNWSQDRLRRSGRHHFFTIAIDAYLSYQWSHGPRTFGKRLYYRFNCGSFPFFVLDTRTQRLYDGLPGDLEMNHLLGRPSHPGAPPGQLQRLLDWLSEQQATRGDVPKFIVSSGVFVPNPMSARTATANWDPEALEKSDGWPGFPATRTAILRRIVDHGVQNVVFLSGDIHCCNVARIKFTGSVKAERLRAFSVTSSAFYWPFPFADGEPSDFVHDSRAKGQEDTFHFTNSKGYRMTMDYKAWNFSQEDNFSCITLDRDSHTMRVRVLDKRGDLVVEEDNRGDKADLDARLELAPW